VTEATIVIVSSPRHALGQRLIVVRDISTANIRDYTTAELILHLHTTGVLAVLHCESRFT
jgi:hypothetical protein